MAEQVDRDKKKHPKSLWWVYALVFVGCAALVVLVILRVPFIIERWAGVEAQPSGPGEYGDQFGVANALFSGLAFAGVIVAILMQSKELQLQREELTETRDVMKGQMEQLELQAASMKRQTFENTFFQMMSLYHQAVEGIVAAGQDWDCSGKSAVSHYRRLYESHFRENLSRQKLSADEIRDWPAQQRFAQHNRYQLDWQNDNGDRFGHYFRYVLKIAEFIDRQSDERNRDFYIGLLCAQFSDSELSLLFYNTVSDASHRAALPLYLKQGLFYNLSPQNLIFERDLELLKFVKAQRKENDTAV